MKILVPLDGSDASESVLPYVRSIGERKGVQVSLLRITDPFFSTHHGRAHELSVETRDKVVASSTGYLKDIENRLSLDEISCWSVVGSPSEEICREARDQDSDLVVMASYAHNVAEEVIRTAPCPVLLVRSPAPERSEFHHILVPIDGSPDSLQLHLHLQAYRGRRTKITLITTSGLTAQDDDYQLARDRVQAYMARLEAELQPLNEEGLEFQVQVLDGEAGPSIVGWAAEEGCDLIAMLSRGHSSTRSFFMGSVTREVLREAPCSVLVYPVAYARSTAPVLSRQLRV